MAISWTKIVLCEAISRAFHTKPIIVEGKRISATVAQIYITVSKSGLIEHAALTGKCSKCLAGWEGPRFSKQLSSGCLHSKEKMGFQLISQMANLSCTRERILQFNINIELNWPICKKEHRLNLECFCLVFRGSNPVEVSSPGFHETLEALLRIS